MQLTNYCSFPSLLHSMLPFLLFWYNHVGATLKKDHWKGRFLFFFFLKKLFFFLNIHKVTWQTVLFTLASLLAAQLPLKRIRNYSFELTHLRLLHLETVVWLDSLIHNGGWGQKTACMWSSRTQNGYDIKISVQANIEKPYLGNHIKFLVSLQLD